MATFPSSTSSRFIYAIRLTYDSTFTYRYVGQTGRGVIRLHQHISEARNIRSGKFHTHKSFWIRKHNFCVTFDILEEVLTEEELDPAEMKWIHILRERGHDLINHTVGGAGVRGHTFSEESREKMSKAKIGTHRSEETKKKIGRANRGKKLSDDHKEKLSLSKIGEENPMFGKPSWNSGKKMEDLIVGYQHPHKGKTFSEEYREKLSSAHKGKPNKGRHTRWHKNRGVLQEDCVFCAQ